MSKQFVGGVDIGDNQGIIFKYIVQVQAGGKDNRIQVHKKIQ